MIIIAYNYSGLIISIVNAKSKELAMAFWQGKSLPVHSIKELDINSLSEHPTGVVTILNTREVDGYELNQNKREAKYILVTKS